MHWTDLEVMVFCYLRTGGGLGLGDGGGQLDQGGQVLLGPGGGVS